LVFICKLFVYLAMACFGEYEFLYIYLFGFVIEIEIIPVYFCLHFLNEVVYAYMLLVYPGDLHN
jgi:hypothetical protein